MSNTLNKTLNNKTSENISNGILDKNIVDKKMNEPLTCTQVTALLSRYQDGETGSDLSGSIGNHLETCRSCAREWTLLQAVASGIKSIPAVDTPDDFTSNVMDAIMQTASKKTAKRSLADSRFYWKRPSFIYSFVFILFLVFGFVINSSLGNGLNGGFSNSNDTVAAAQNTGTEFIAGILNDSQDLKLIDVQDQTLAILYDTASPQKGKSGQW